MLNHLLVVLAITNSISCVTVEKNDGNSYQRRFMWREMDHTMGDLMENFYSSARQVKQAFGGMLPTFQSPTYNSAGTSTYQGTMPSHLAGYKKSNDIMPSTTVRIKYIVRKPVMTSHTSVHYRYPKNFLKLMNANKNSLEATPQKSKLGKPKTLSSYTEKPLEEQTNFSLLDKNGHTVQAAPYHEHMKPHQYNDGVQFSEEKAQWRPLYQISHSGAYLHNNHQNIDLIHHDDHNHEGAGPVATIKPLENKGLHTSVISEILPEPERQISKPLKEVQTYEVTENYQEEGEDEENDSQNLDDYDQYSPDKFNHIKEKERISTTLHDPGFTKNQSYIQISSDMETIFNNENYSRKPKGYSRFSAKNLKRDLPKSSFYNSHVTTSPVDSSKINKDKYASEWRPLGKASKYSPNPPDYSTNQDSNSSQSYSFTATKPKFYEWSISESRRHETTSTTTENYPYVIYSNNEDSEGQQTEVKTASTKAPSSRKAAFYRQREIRQRGSVKFKEKDLESK